MVYVIGTCPRHRTPTGPWAVATVHPADAVQDAGTPVGEGLARRSDRRTAAGLSCSRASASSYSCSAYRPPPLPPVGTALALAAGRSTIGSGRELVSASAPGEVFVPGKGR